MHTPTIPPSRAGILHSFNRSFSSAISTHTFSSHWTVFESSMGRPPPPCSSKSPSLEKHAQDSLSSLQTSANLADLRRKHGDSIGRVTPSMGRNLGSPLFIHRQVGEDLGKTAVNSTLQRGLLTLSLLTKRNKTRGFSRCPLVVSFFFENKKHRASLLAQVGLTVLRPT